MLAGRLQMGGRSVLGVRMCGWLGRLPHPPLLMSLMLSLISLMLSLMLSLISLMTRRADRVRSLVVASKIAGAVVVDQREPLRGPQLEAVEAARNGR